MDQFLSESRFILQVFPCALFIAYAIYLLRKLVPLHEISLSLVPYQVHTVDLYHVDFL